MMMEATLPQRSARHARKSAETDISLSLTLDGSGKTDIQTGFGMLDHMLTLTAFWAGMDLHLRCQGDLHIDAHHSAEDIGLVLGRVPMDEALSDVTIDLSGRPWLEWRGDELLPPVIAGEEKDLWREFYKAFASSARCNLHVTMHYGKNGHHLLESVAKSLGLALAQAVRRSGNVIRSTKGGLD